MFDKALTLQIHTLQSCMNFINNKSAKGTQALIYCFLGVSALQKHDPIKLKMAANTFSIGEESNITPQVWGQQQARGAGRGAVQETREHLFLCDRGDCYSMLLLPGCICMLCPPGPHQPPQCPL